mgnify:CR=1 FL=1
MRKAGAKNYINFSKEILKITKKPVSFEVFADDYKNIDCNGLAKVYFKNITDGFISNDNNLLIEFGSENINILPITKMPDKNAKCVSGHHHLIVDSELPNLKRPIPSGKNYLHFGKGQEEASIFLEEGTHTIQLLLGIILIHHMINQFTLRKF